MVEILEQEFSRISMDLGCRTDDRIVTIVQSKQAYYATTGAMEWSGGQFDGKIRIPVSETKSISPQTRRTFAHETVHACLATMGQWPSWLHEGLAQKFSGDTVPAGARTQMRAAIKAGKLPTLGAMDRNFSRMSSESAAMSYAYSLVAADLMVERYRAYGLQNILRNPERLPQVEAELDKLLVE